MNQDPGGLERLRIDEKPRKPAIKRLQQAPKRRKARRHGAEPALKGPRRAHTDKQAHQEGKFQSGGVNQHSLENVRTSAEVYPTQTSGLVRVCEWSLEQFATLTKEPSAPSSTNPSSIAIH